MRLSAQVVVGRQPIVDRHEEVDRVSSCSTGRRPRTPAVDGGRNTDPQISGEQMTAQVVLGALTIGLYELIGDKAMFCNAERGGLIAEGPPLVTLPLDRTVIEVLEERRHRRRDGGRAATWWTPASGWRLTTSRGADGRRAPAGARQHVKIALPGNITATTSRPWSSGAARSAWRLLAEKVETPTTSRSPRANGFELFQGYAIERPAWCAAPPCPPRPSPTCRLAMTLLSQDIEFEEVEDDPAPRARSRRPGAPDGVGRQQPRAPPPGAHGPARRWCSSAAPGSGSGSR